MAPLGPPRNFLLLAAAVILSTAAFSRSAISVLPRPPISSPASAPALNVPYLNRKPNWKTIYVVVAPVAMSPLPAANESMPAAPYCGASPISAVAGEISCAGNATTKHIQDFVCGTLVDQSFYDASPSNECPSSEKDQLFVLQIEWADVIELMILIVLLIFVSIIVIVIFNFSSPQTRKDDDSVSLKLNCWGFMDISGHKEWDDGDAGCMKQIFIWYKDYIHGIQIIYEKNSSIIIGEMHGTRSGMLETVYLRGPLTWMSGYYCDICPHSKVHNVITLLEFGDKKKTYGPFGIPNGHYFSYICKDEISRFHGWYNNISPYKYISAIGPYIKINKL